MSEENKKKKKKEYQKIIVKLIKADSLNLINNFSFCWSFFLSLYAVLAQYCSFKDAFIAFNDTLLFWVK